MITPDAAKKLVDERLKSEFDALEKRADAIASPYGELVRAVRVVTEQGGKRLRPYMTLLMYEAYGGTIDDNVISLAVAEEFLHVAMLVHDDIIDQDTIRHGVKNVTGQYLETYDIADPVRHRHEADSMALMAGDLLQARSYLLVSSVKGAPEAKEAIENLFVTTVERVIGGQVLDTQAPFVEDPTDPLVIAEHKTASYTFEMPLLTGAILAGASNSEQQLLRELGKQVGIGYQLMDDLLGVFGDEAETGKSTEGDIREGKRTTLVQAFDKLAKDADRQAFYAVFGRPGASSEEIAKARTILESSGARQIVEKELVRIARKASAIVGRLAIPAQYKTGLLALAERGLSRAK